MSWAIDPGIDFGTSAGISGIPGCNSHAANVPLNHQFNSLPLSKTFHPPTFRWPPRMLLNLNKVPLSSLSSWEVMNQTKCIWYTIRWYGTQKKSRICSMFLLGYSCLFGLWEMQFLRCPWSMSNFGNTAAPCGFVSTNMPGGGAICLCRFGGCQTHHLEDWMDDPGTNWRWRDGWKKPNCDVLDDLSIC